jgi:indolepyruvate ferredoxin oxidoreductase
MATAALPTTASTPHRLADRYELDEGRVFLSGVQALVRLLLDQRRADAAAGQRTGIMVSGYQGSPLGGFDREVAGLRDLANAHDIFHRPGVNEELGATAVWGSQMATSLPGARYDGVLGVWYGKAPGVDRAADAIRHGNFAGTDPRGGVLALCGDDPECKSSTLPSASESILAALEVPVFAPGSVQELLDLGRHAIACSRASGLWAALKVATAAADATATVEVGSERVVPVIPRMDWEGRPYVHRPSAHLLAPQSLEMERTLREVRLELAKRYGRVNGLNEVIAPAPGARLGIVAAGTAFHQLEQALIDLGLDGDGHLRLLKVGMPYPLDELAVREFAAGLEEVLVVEEKGPFLERAVKDALYGTTNAPLVTGGRDDLGDRLLAPTGALSADLVAAAVGRRVLARREVASVRTRLDQLRAVGDRPAPEVGAVRAPHFCSGCPHSASTKAADDIVVGAGIGCHTMVMLNPSGRGAVSGITQMGGEGVQWIGAAPFLEPRHFVQNLGDGTMHHSGSLAVRAAVAAGLNVTYKVLYNDTVAMTGGQHVEGQMTVPQLVRSLEAEGVRKVVITADDVGSYRGVALPAIADVRGKTSLAAAQRELAKVEGVTVLIHDQACATELRRARKRGKATEPPQQIHINERVCEGCGDCGEKSGCLSVEPVDTEFGRKTRIHQSSCNKDFSCLEGDCPSFMEVIPAKAGKAGRAHKPAPRAVGVELPEPTPSVPTDDVRLRLIGIGGTGVVTVSQVLGMAALIDGRFAAGLDQTGLSQKAGPVASDLRISTAAVDGEATASAAGIDVLVGLDVVATATVKHLALADPARTIAVVSTSVVPTAQMVLDPRAGAPDVAAARAGIEAMTRADDDVFFDAQELALAVFGDHMPANVMVLGAAWQRGAVPVSLDAMRQAFTLNGTAAEQNLAAFDWGRAVVAAPDVVAAALADETAPAPLGRADRELVDHAAGDSDGELRRLLEVRVPDLVGWGGRDAAVRYVAEIARVRAIEDERLPGSTAVTERVARGLHKLTAYKDEYEVARLQLDGLSELPKGAKVKFLLHPPLLRAMGMDRKIKLGRWFVPAFRVLKVGRRLRGTALDPFGRAEVRRVERALPGEYLALVDAALAQLTPATLETVAAVAELPDVVRGYEEIKLAGVERFRADAAELMTQLG